MTFFDRTRRSISALLARAGRANQHTIDTPVEALEPRQLLAVFTIPESSVDPATGLGSIQANFAYFIPYLAYTQAPQQPQPVQPVLEDFNRNEPVGPGGGGPAPATNIPSGFTYSASNIRFDYAVPAPDPALPFANPQQLGGLALVTINTQDSNNAVRATFGERQYLSVRVAFGNTGVNTNSFLLLSQMTMNIQSLDTDVTAVQIISDGVVLQTLTGNALANLGIPQAGGFRQYTFTAPGGQTFDQVRFFKGAGASSGTTIFDNIAYTVPQGRGFAQLLDGRQRAFTARLTGPVGASFEILDLYNRPLRPETGIGIPPGAQVQVTLADPADTGIPRYNDGIGRINLTGTNARSAFTIVGGSLTAAATPQANSDYAFAGFAGSYPTSATAFYDGLEQSGFGFATVVQNNTITIGGLPSSAGTVVIGSPFVRPQNNYLFNPVANAVPGISNFESLNQGVFVAGDIGTVNIPGIMHGFSRIQGRAERFATDLMVGSLRVDGDLGSFINGSDAGVWVGDNVNNNQFAAKTNSQLIVGRTLGQVQIAGRSKMDIIVNGDLSSPTSAPSRNVYTYREREHMLFNTRPTDQNINVQFQFRQLLVGTGAEYAGFVGNAAFANQQSFFANTTFRNDTILSSEFVGNASSAAEITGSLGGADPLNTASDPSDVYAFPALAGQPIVVRPGGAISSFIAAFAAGFGNAYARIVDVDGRTLASTRATEAGGQRPISQLEFTPTTSGVYYLVLQSNQVPGTQDIVDLDYSVVVTGMAPVTLGLVRTGSGLGGVASGTLSGSGSITVASGSIGSIRSGTGFVSGAGQETVSDGILNASFGVLGGFASEAAFGIVTISAPSGDLYSIAVGKDIETQGLPATLTIGGNLWNVTTGVSALYGRGPTNGDLRQVNWSIGGRLGLLDIRSAIGIDTDAATDETARPSDGNGSVTIATGRNPQLRGDVGLIRVGRTMGGQTMTLTTPDGSSIGGILVTQDQEIGNATFGGIRDTQAGQPPINLNIGANSDVRFFDSEFVSSNGVIGVTTTLFPGVPVTFTDDSGARVTINIRPGPAGGGFGFLNLLPVRGGQGVSIGRINVNLAGGAALDITGVQPQGSVNPLDVVSIGRIIVTDGDINSSINISGPIEIDVWRIDQRGGTTFGSITNSTRRGDIVVADMAGLTSITITNGDLGRTQLVDGAPVAVGPFLGIGRTPSTTAGGAFSVPQNVITGFWNGNTFRAVNNAIVSPGAVSFADDVGMPLDPYLDGLRVRNGSLQSASVGGGIGDIVVPQGQILSATANADNVNNSGRFEGIFGNVYANRISSVSVGDGLDALTSSPFAKASIAADDDINQIIAPQAGANILGLIAVGNNIIGNADPNTYPTDGINTINLSGGGSFIGSSIVAGYLSDFFQSIFSPDDGLFAGRVNSISTVTPPGPIGAPAASGGGFVGSFFSANSLNELRLGGAYDGSVMRIGNDGANLIQAREFKNSTLQAGDLEQRPNTITVSGDVGTLTTTNRAGDMTDLTFVGSRLLGEVSARNIDRSSINAASEITLVQTARSMRGSSITSGRLPTVTVGASLVASTIESASGAITTLTAVDDITNATIRALGTDGRIISVRAPQISGEIFSVGRIDSIEATQGDFRATITTVLNQRGVAGGVGLLRAARDLDIDGDIAGKVDTLRAGRHIGNRLTPKVLVLRGDVDLIDAPNGTLYNDIRTTGAIAQATFGRVNNKPGTSILGRGGLYAFNRIQNVNIAGDWAGNIVSYSGGIGVVAVSDGSILGSALIAAYAGDVGNIFITRGNLLGDIHADWNLFNVRIDPSADGVFGDIGINPASSAGVSSDDFRNQLPPGVIGTTGIDGPSITAGRNIGRIFLPGGSMFEATIIAGRALGTVEVVGDIRTDNATTGFGTLIAAGSSINAISATGAIRNTQVIAGLVSLGADNRPGGTADNADTMQSGRITSVRAQGQMANVAVVAGVENLQYSGTTVNFSNATVPLGTSFIRAVTAGGGVANVVALADSPTAEATAGITLAGTAFANSDPDTSNGFLPGVLLVNGNTLNTSLDGNSLRITFAGRGRASYDAATRTITLVNTGLDSTLTVIARTPGNAVADLTSFRIVTNDDASMGQITVDANLSGDSRIVVDAYSLGITTGNVTGNARVAVGMNLRQLTTGSVSGGSINAAFWARAITINGNLGSIGLPASSTVVSALASGGLTITGNHSGLVTVDRDLGPVAINGQINGGLLRVGSTLGNLTIGSIQGGRISAGDSMGTVAIAGNANETNIQAGADLGRDASPGGTGVNADSVRAGSIGNVTVGGNFQKASLIAGSLRGPDGFFGTIDDVVAPGRSTVGNVAIAGSQVGSNLSSEQYRIAAATSIGTVTVAGSEPANTGNFRVATTPQDAASIRVLDITTQQLGGVWVAAIQFNQPMDVSTILTSLSIAQVRDEGNTLIPIDEGIDYLAGEWNANTNTFTVRFRTELTNRSLVPAGPLPLIPGGFVAASQNPVLAGPGVYRFTLDGAILRATQTAARLDANNDGTPTANENYVRDRVVGDAGDRAVDPFIAAINTGNNTVGYVGLNDAVDLNLVLRDPQSSAVVPHINTTNTVRGVIGDHPNQNTGLFSAPSDSDVYRLTLQAGQILELSGMRGTATGITPLLYSFDGTSFQFQSGDTDRALSLPVQGIDITNPNALFTRPQNFLIKESGTYFIVVSNFPFGTVFSTPVVPTLVASPNNFGDYNFSISVFDDGNSGFNAGTAAGTGDNVPNAPLPVAFAGPDGQFGTVDDRDQIVVGTFTFNLNRGPDGRPNTSDDIVSGTEPSGLITSERRNFNQLSIVANEAIGPRGHRGVPGDLITPDVDVFNLNNGSPIQAGRVITIKVNLAQFGADLGSVNLRSAQNFNGAVQFGVFDVSNSSRIDDGQLVFASSEFKSVPQAQRAIASEGASSYSYDADGNFTITFVTPGRLGADAGTPATYAILLQGVYNTDYQLVVTQTDTTAVTAAPTPRRQNILIETRGGTINWLEAGGLTTALAPFTTSVLGLNGSFSGVPVDQYVLNRVVNAVQQIFTNSGLDVVVSANPAAFEFQDFSTIFLTSTNDPTTVFNTVSYGYSERVDAFNLDRRDEGVVFVPSLSDLGFTASQTDANNLSNALAAAVTRRAAELMGARIALDDFSGSPVIDVLAANSVSNFPGSQQSYRILDQVRRLSDPTNLDSISNTDFFIGSQNAFALLRKFVNS